ncbi:hypothetical protein AHAS_Ahas10G0107700 [Arachis hypogaea]
MEEEGEGKGKGIHRRYSSPPPLLLAAAAAPHLRRRCSSLPSLLSVVRSLDLAAAPRHSVLAAAPRLHLAIIPITETRTNPARSFGVAIIFNRDHAWNDQWIFWVELFIRATLATV